LSKIETESLAVRPRTAWFLCFLLASLSGSLSPSSQVSQGALYLVRYDGTGCIYRGQPGVLVSLSLSPLRHELLVVQQMRRLSALRLGADMRQEAARLALCV
jgi:hypothetical protein